MIQSLECKVYVLSILFLDENLSLVIIVNRCLIRPGKANCACALLDRRRGSGRSDNNGVDVIRWAADVSSVGNEAA